VCKKTKEANSGEKNLPISKTQRKNRRLTTSTKERI
jgi:hypothetical protein